MKFCLIYNKCSSNGKKSNYIKEIYNFIKKDHSIDLFETYTKLEASNIIKDIFVNKYDRLILAGGDGTVSFAINELISNKIYLPDNFALGYIPVGTTNILQTELGLNKSAIHNAKILVSNNIKQANLVKINGKHFILMAGIGWDAQIVESITPKFKRTLGKIFFVIKGLQKIIFMKNKNIKVIIDNKVIYANWVLCCNSKYYAGNYSINNTNIFKEEFITFIFKNFNKTQILYYIYSIIVCGNLPKSKNIIVKKSKKIKLEGINDYIPIQIDGDSFGNYKKIDISNSKIKLNLIYSNNVN